MFALPGTPTLYYGEEIGMGEDLAADGRMAVRTPMQWDAGPNGGFSSAAPRKLIQRVAGGGYGPEHVNLADQEHDPDSLWSFFRELIAVRRRRQEFGWGEFEVIEQPERAVLAHRISLADSSVVALHNLGADPVTVTLPSVLTGNDVLEDLLDGDAVLPHEGELTVALAGYGFRWLRVTSTG